jgi:hypothetical protein
LHDFRVLQKRIGWKCEKMGIGFCACLHNFYSIFN